MAAIIYILPTGKIHSLLPRSQSIFPLCISLQPKILSSHSGADVNKISSCRNFQIIKSWFLFVKQFFPQFLFLLLHFTISREERPSLITWLLNLILVFSRSATLQQQETISLSFLLYTKDLHSSHYMFSTAF